MLSDVLKALELLMDTVRSAKSPEKKRQKIAKQLLRLYLDLQRIAERGNDILNILKGEYSVYYDVALSKLQAQQRALQDLIDDINGLEGLALLELHLPHFKVNLTVLTYPKVKRIGFWISQLTLGKELNNYELGHLRLQLDAADKLLVDYGERSDLMSAKPEWIGYVEDCPVRVFGCARQVLGAEEVLVKIEQLAEELRQFIIEKFEFSDVL